jgi:class 3 adenylate cyclase
MEQSRETTVLFAALIGTQDLHAKAGAEKGHEAMERCHLRLGQAAVSCGGRLALASADKLMVLTATPDAAADAASAMHLAMEKLPKTADVKLGMGVGFHYGPVIQKGDEVFGDTVVLAARLCEHAGNGQILLTEWTAKLLSPLYRGWLRNLDKAQIKGRTEEIALCELVWRADDNATAFARWQPQQQPTQSVLRLKHKGKEIERRRDKDFVTIGRGDDCGLVVHEENASRQHCKIERRKDKWVLVDLSTNGTYVTIEGDKEMALNKEELVLSKKGWITLGLPRVHAAEVVEFTLEEK